MGCVTKSNLPYVTCRALRVAVFRGQCDFLQYNLGRPSLCRSCKNPKANFQNAPRIFYFSCHTFCSKSLFRHQLTRLHDPEKVRPLDDNCPRTSGSRKLCILHTFSRLVFRPLYTIDSRGVTSCRPSAFQLLFPAVYSLLRSWLRAHLEELLFGKPDT